MFIAKDFPLQTLQRRVSSLRILLFSQHHKHSIWVREKSPVSLHLISNVKEKKVKQRNICSRFVGKILKNSAPETYSVGSF